MGDTGSGGHGRLYFADNLRWSMIVLVVFIHASVTYGPLGSWFYRDSVNATETSDVILSIFGVFVQGFFMGMLFLLAGYFTPGSFQRKGMTKFVKDRAIRLGVPAMIFIFFIAPPIVYYPNEDYWRGQGTATFVEWLGDYLPDPSKWDTGPLWFTLALLAFTFVWVGMASLRGGWNSDGRIRLRYWHLLAVVFIMGLGSFVVRIWHPIGTDVWNMQLCFFPQYITLFMLGTFAFGDNWLLGIERGMSRLWNVILIILVIVVFPILTVAGGALEEETGTDAYFGGLHWQSLAFAFWVESYCVAMIVSLLFLYKERLNYQGRVLKYLSDNSFTVYVFHAPVVVGIGMALHSVDLPVLLKFLVLALCCLPLVYLLAGFAFRKIPLLRRIL
ncbi:MAG: acyltransferase family protein [Methanobacteriota archaeon]|nr:MAG: acyltransferase family protein [Euryarchaeota archaeon]